MRETRAKVITLVVDEDLGLVFEAAKRAGVDDAVAVALELIAKSGRFFSDPPPARRSNGDRIGGQVGHVSPSRHGLESHPWQQRSMRSPEGKPSRTDVFENALQQIRRKLRSHERGSDALQQHEPQAPQLDLLV